MNKTIYFADYKCIKLIDKDKYELYAISLTVPKWYKYKRCRKLRPAYALMKFFNSIKNPDEEDKRMYLESYYRTVLIDLKPDELIKQLDCGKNIVFISYEDARTFGHKEAIKLWFKEYGYSCVDFILTE